MIPTPPAPSKKRKRGDVTVLSVNVQGVDPDALCRAVKRIKPDILALQEAPAQGHTIYKTLNKAVTELNNDTSSNTDFEFTNPEVHSEFHAGKFLQVSKKVHVYADQSVKNYCLIYNKKKLNLTVKPKLLNYAKDRKRQKDVQRVKDMTSAINGGFGARPPLHMEFEMNSDQKRIGFFLWHAPTITDNSHQTAMKYFEESEVVEDSKNTNHMTICSGDFNDQLSGHFLDFKEGIDHKFDHVVAHKAASHYDLLNDHRVELDQACTSTQDHFPMAAEFNFK